MLDIWSSREASKKASSIANIHIAATNKSTVHDEWFGKTIIYSDRRFSYNEAQDIIDSGSGDFSKELQLLNRLAQQLRTQRFKNGSISFEREEVRFDIDEIGKPLGIHFREHGTANELIEEFDHRLLNEHDYFKTHNPTSEHIAYFLFTLLWFQLLE